MVKRAALLVDHWDRRSAPPEQHSTQHPGDRSQSATRAPRRWTPTLVPLLGLAAVALVVVAAAWDRTPGRLDIADAIVLGLVEGVTEYLPVSSTGHLTVTQQLLGVTGNGSTEAADAYAICIQFGAILAVALVYRRRLVAVASGILGRNEAGRQLARCLVAAFVPAAVVGLLFGDLIKSNLFGIWPVVGAWAVGGVAILVIEPRVTGGTRSLEQLRMRAALFIGAAQVLALWPGVSRSLVTILAALAVGLTARAAVEFSFLLGLATLTAATGYEALGQGATIVEEFGVAAPLVGLVVALLSAVVAVRWLVAYLNRGSFAVFGWYRLAAAAVVGLVALTPAL